MDQSNEDESGNDDLPNYRSADEISPSEISVALRSLCLLGGDPYLAMQITGIAIVDQFITGIEYDVLRELHETERTPPAAGFLSAQTQMWIFAVYELLRTWREQAKDVIKWAKNGGLELKIQALEKKLPYRHYGQELRASQLRRVVNEPGMIETIMADLRLTHYLFADLEHIRVSMAKHQVSGKAKSIAFAPGYGRINQWCGSLISVGSRSGDLRQHQPTRYRGSDLRLQRSLHDTDGRGHRAFRQNQEKTGDYAIGVQNRQWGLLASNRPLYRHGQTDLPVL